MKKPVVRRNLAAKNNPLLRKGGVHRKSRKAERRKDRVALARKALEQSAENSSTLCSNAFRELQALIRLEQTVHAGLAH